MLFLTITCSTTQINRVEPPNWWLGFKNSSLQLMVYGREIGVTTPSITYAGVSLDSFHRGDSPNYIFLDLKISENASPGIMEIQFTRGKGKAISYSYPLHERERSSEEFHGFDSSDAIYLVTPDRFSQGSPKIENVNGLLDIEIDRKNDYARHGGDIRGIINHLDYIAQMGFTALWPTPLLTNNMAESSYHGYAMTDFYEVDPRFGTLEDYVLLSDKASEYGIKLLMDQVANHCGLNHWWMSDLPFTDWINYQSEYQEGSDALVTNHRRTVNQDLYASKVDKDLMNNGWFVPSMPDLNQNNPFMANYIIQNSIWWIETLKLGGIRQDSYSYPDKEFMSRWAGSIMDEYPNFNIVGEEWTYNPLLVRYWQQGIINSDGYESNLKTTMDFPLQRRLIEAINEDEHGDSGLVKIYEGLANDFAYYDPSSILYFGDNHDMDRLYTQLYEDFEKMKMALAFIGLVPRIPQIYYGTEILLSNRDKPGDHGRIRSDFPGGWEGDEVNAFNGEGLSTEQKEMQEFTRKLLNYRKGSTAIHEGKTIHFVPEDGVYVLFRQLKDETIMLILNKNDLPYALDLKRFNEMKLIGNTFKNILTSEEVIFNSQLHLENNRVLLFTSKFS
ncbi:glycoside hydrolase family 13 protein [uncultured Eudoraea sp.]|uniref:glycoside hydrolase family 13 protein n=1 Tax=uncultured Eudoraea sp. TaxID=1035614 RepID=UPI002630B3FE|nr:glycoside hydrolase family 13 protein [uncultured Eudoraea sp.]